MPRRLSQQVGHWAALILVVGLCLVLATLFCGTLESTTARLP